MSLSSVLHLTFSRSFLVSLDSSASGPVSRIRHLGQARLFCTESYISLWLSWISGKCCRYFFSLTRLTWSIASTATSPNATETKHQKPLLPSTSAISIPLEWTTLSAPGYHHRDLCRCLALLVGCISLFVSWRFQCGFLVRGAGVWRLEYRFSRRCRGCRGGEEIS